jgi:hypothetical protein
VLLEDDVAASAARAQTCDSCVYFDLVEGQKRLSTHPTFGKVKEFLSPDQIGRVGVRSEFDPETGEPRDTPNAKTQEALGGRPHTWDQYGYCGKHGEARNRFMTYDCYEARS